MFVHNSPPQNPQGRRTDELSWAPKTSAVVVFGIGGVLMAVAAATLGNDVAGRLLITLAAVALLVIAATGAYIRPRLQVVDVAPDGPGLAVRGLSGRRVYTPQQMRRVRVTSYPRLGRRVKTLEIDAREPEDRLIVLSRWDLGTDPQDVYDALDGAGALPPQP
ncbi:PH domain-containing protein [Rhodococcus sp. D2-41]|uniref:PH domain-containing protein n=1 Tax=Speluncibacter jeojiensis TaxID=2710754 RepID=UPI00240EF647|nr:PH domain-containing protein [Rhodococcus sp. D2-41]MDG3012898.1 PH domain-containing protein [Rhodococcus sp. D2-41]